VAKTPGSDDISGAKESFVRVQLQAGARGITNHNLRLQPFVEGGAGAENVFFEIDNAQSTVRGQGIAHVDQQADGIIKLRVGIHDKDRVEVVGQMWIEWRPENRLDVLQPVTGDPPADRFNHLALNVLRKDAPVRTHAPGQSHGEPAAAGANVADSRAVGDCERVHDAFGLLPFFAIGTLQFAEFLRWEQAAVRCARLLYGGRPCQGQPGKQQ
jgi:hypothetical protein